MDKFSFQKNHKGIVWELARFIQPLRAASFNAQKFCKEQKMREKAPPKMHSAYFV